VAVTRLDYHPALKLLRGQVLHRDRILEQGVNVWQIQDLVQSGTWSRLLPEVYFTGLLTSAEAPLALLRIQAAVLWAGREFVLGGDAAAWWHRWLPTPPDVIEIHIRQERKLSPQPGFWIRRTDLDVADLTERRGVVTTAAPRTALDLAARGSTDLLDTMLRDGWFDQAALDAALRRGAGRRGWIRAREALAECAFRPFSAAERRLHRGLLAAGVDGWIANVRLTIQGKDVIPDLLFQQAGLAVEIDGERYHSDPAAFQRDRIKQNLLVAAGYTVLRFTWRQLVEDLDGVIRAIAAELQRAAA
jgi:very-short-patch-repair endonuclease